MIPSYPFSFLYFSSRGRYPVLQVYQDSSSLSDVPPCLLKLCVRNRSKCKGALRISLKSLGSKKQIVLQYKPMYIQLEMKTSDLLKMKYCRHVHVESLSLTYFKMNQKCPSPTNINENIVVNKTKCI